MGQQKLANFVGPPPEKKFIFFLHFEKKTANKICWLAKLFCWLLVFGFSLAEVFFFSPIFQDYLQVEKKTANSFCWQANFLSWPKLLFFQKSGFKKKTANKNREGQHWR